MNNNNSNIIIINQWSHYIPLIVKSFISDNRNQGQEEDETTKMPFFKNKPV